MTKTQLMVSRRKMTFSSDCTAAKKLCFWCPTRDKSEFQGNKEKIIGIN